MVRIKAESSFPQLIKCSITDHFVFRTPVPIAFFYKQHIAQDILVRALQIVLSDFQIFAGSLVRKNGELSIDCNNAGVDLTVVRKGTPLFGKPIDFVDMLKPRKLNGPLLTIKLTYCSDGMAIGYCWHHTVGDMSTFMGFLKALSLHVQGKDYEKPIVNSDREEFLQTIPAIQEPKISRLKVLNTWDIFRLIKQVFSPKKSLYLSFTEEEVCQLRAEISEHLDRKVSRNDALCAHLLKAIDGCRTDNSPSCNASVVVNLRPRLNLPSNLQGNFVDVAPIQVQKPFSVYDLAGRINCSVKKFQATKSFSFVQKNGGIKNIGRIIPQDMLPQYKNLIITNWSNFDVYSIDFGTATPFFVMPIAVSPIPWVASIVEGAENRGLLVTLVLPSRLARKIKQTLSNASVVSKLLN